MRSSYLSILNKIDFFEKYVTYDTAIEGLFSNIKERLANGLEYLISTIKELIRKVKEWFNNLKHKNKEDVAIHQKMFTQYKVAFNETKKILDQIGRRYSLVDDWETISENVADLKDIWEKTIRAINVIKNSDNDDKYYKHGYGNEAKQIETTIVNALNNIIKNIQSIPDEDAGLYSKEAISSISKTLGELTSLVAIIQRGYMNMLYENRNNVFIKTDGELSGSTY